MNLWIVGLHCMRSDAPTPPGARSVGDTVRAFRPRGAAAAAVQERGNVRKKSLWVLGLLALALVLAACSAPNACQDTLKPVGEVAKQQKSLFVPVFWVAVVVFVIVQGGILFIAIRYRHRKGQDRMPKQTHGNTRLEIGWTIAAGGGARGGHGAHGLADLGSRPRGPGRRAQHHGRGLPVVVGVQYPDEDTATDGTRPSRSPTTMVVPTGRDIYLSLRVRRAAARRTPTATPTSR